MAYRRPLENLEEVCMIWKPITKAVLGNKGGGTADRINHYGANCTIKNQ
jgi:hypothetical protein